MKIEMILSFSFGPALSVRRQCRALLIRQGATVARSHRPNALRAITVVPSHLESLGQRRRHQVPTFWTSLSNH